LEVSEWKHYKEERMRKNSRGFSLIELLIVVAIILIIAAIAIPNLLRSRIAANQASAVGSLRTINTSEITYASTFNTGFSGTLAELGPGATPPTASAAGLLDSVLAGGSKSGYTFVYTAGAADTTGRINTYAVTASPISTSTGTNYYFTDESGVIRQNTTGTASATDSPLAG
jgi:type IV pilus assembly protein PilA